METYRKPTIVAYESIGGIIPLAALAGMSAAKLAVVGVAAGLGLGAAMKGGHVIDSSRRKFFAVQKNFALD